ncbi:MAG TPA: hypothetical protein VFK57_19825 [Vicinamibacterales bacterium]|nr:hypothetical protein [Vicinamibacterales bacterium]
MTPDPMLVFHLRTVGVLMALLAAVNLFVPGRFNWREELARVSLLNRQIFQAHTVFIVLVIALMSALLLFCAEALLEPTRLSRAVLLGLTVFWGLRMLMQWFFYSPEVWRGNRLHTVLHGVFSLGWIYVTAVCGMALRAIS